MLGFVGRLYLDSCSFLQVPFFFFGGAHNQKPRIFFIHNFFWASFSRKGTDPMLKYTSFGIYPCKQLCQRGKIEPWLRCPTVI